MAEVIPAEAFEAANKAVYRNFKGLIRPLLVKVALEAAAPHMRPMVTTEEELDALPIGTVVLSERYHSDVDGTAISFQRWYDGDWHRGARAGSTHPDNFLPVIILHRPTDAV